MSRINPAPYNPRRDLRIGDPEYEQLRRSLDEFGLVEPLVWNRRTRHLIGGHQRLKVLKARGDTTAIVSVVDLEPAREKALNIALNRIQGEWDQDKLAALLDALSRTPDLDLELTGFSQEDADALIAEVLHGSDPSGEESFDVEAAMRWAGTAGDTVTRPGDLIELGQDPRFSHRLLCGDCTDPEQVGRLMNGERAVLFATDPPYLVGYDGTNHPASKRRGKPPASRPSPGKKKASSAAPCAPRDGNKDWSGTYGVTWDDADANPELYEKFVKVAIEEAIAEHAAWYCWHASKRQAMLESVWERAGAFVHQQIVWAKDRGVLTRSWYLWRHEPCLFGWRSPHKPPRRTREILSSVWEVPTIPVGQATEHPTSKPVQLFEIPILQHTRKGEVCYEPFAGSGTQLIAAQKHGRRCMALEISPAYCDVIVRRFIAYAGEEAVGAEVARRYRVSPRRAKGAA